MNIFGKNDIQNKNDEGSTHIVNIPIHVSNIERRRVEATHDNTDDNSADDKVTKSQKIEVLEDKDEQECAPLKVNEASQPESLPLGGEIEQPIVMTFDMTQPRDVVQPNSVAISKPQDIVNNKQRPEVLTFDMHDESDGVGVEVRKLKMEEARRRKLARLRRRTEQHRRRRELRMKDREEAAKQKMEKEERIKSLQSHDMMGVVGSHWNVEDERKDTNSRAYEAWKNVENEVMAKPEGKLLVGGDNNTFDADLGLDGLIPLSEIRNAIFEDAVPSKSNNRPSKSDESHPSLLRQPSASLQQQRQAAIKAASLAKPGIGVSQQRAMMSTAKQYGQARIEHSHDKNDLARVSRPTNFRKKLKGPSNRKKVCLALKNVCLAGAHLFDEHSDARNAIGDSSSENFLILMGKKEKLTYRGLYAINTATKEACLIHGAGPEIVEQRMVSGYFKYSTGTRSFAEIGGTKTFTATTDAITLKPEFLKRRARRRTQLNLDYRAKVMANMDRGRGMFQLH